MAQTYYEIADRSKEAYNFHQELVLFFPESARFLYRAADYAVNKMGKPDEALVALKARLNDVRKETDEEKSEAAQAQALLEKLEKDMQEALANASPNGAASEL